MRQLARSVPRGVAPPPCWVMDADVVGTLASTASVFLNISPIRDVLGESANEQVSPKEGSHEEAAVQPVAPFQRPAPWQHA